jgi:16S rRNA (guanine966-N2)-methyltransferase
VEKEILKLKNQLMAKRKGSSNRIRIIGGEWRSRQLPFIEVPGLRPTPDRVRETLFNWLQGRISSARCLDLFAGSGAIGFEALSRYAAEVVLVEKHAKVAQQLRDNLASLKIEDERRALIVNKDALMYVEETAEAFDIIFLDPPYRKGLLPKVLDQIVSRSLLNTDGIIYLEHESEEQFDWLNWDLEVFKQSNAGQVCGVLLEFKTPQS